jgi:Family of unknown function (DUF6163)
MAISLRRRQPVAPPAAPVGDRIEERPRAEPGIRWSSALRWFMRLLSIAWIIKGLAAWAVIVGLWSPEGPFEALAMGYQATVIYFAVFDLIAAVGLWMASTWGGVMWLLAVMSHLILSAFFPHILSDENWASALMIAAIAAYLSVSWLSARETQV